MRDSLGRVDSQMSKFLCGPRPSNSSLEKNMLTRMPMLQAEGNTAHDT